MIPKRLTDPSHILTELTKKWKDNYSKLFKKENQKIIEEYADRETAYPPIFVIGPPRSGTTLFYQLLVHRFHFAYIQNQMAFYRHAIPWFTKNKLNPNKPYVSDFESTLGKTSQDVGPNGGLFFWDRFFPGQKNDYYRDFQFSNADKIEIKGTINFLSEYLDAPFLSKNLLLSLALKPIQSVFPEAIFIRVNRDPRSIASSIRDERIKAYETDDKWRLMRPASYPELLSKPPHIQIAQQVSEILEALNQDIDSDAKLIDVQYESFCARPNEILNSLEKQLLDLGIPLKNRNKVIPEKFNFKKTVSFNEKELNEINDWFELKGTFRISPPILDLDKTSNLN